jgi:quinol monooxygenase YgiN
MDEEGTMYGTIAKLKAKPGALEALRQMESSRRPTGYLGSYVFKSDNDPNELWLVVFFENKATYMANADSPEQDKEFRKLMEALSAEPEWHDGEIVFASKPI